MILLAKPITSFSGFAIVEGFSFKLKITCGGRIDARR